MSPTIAINAVFYVHKKCCRRLESFTVLAHTSCRAYMFLLLCSQMSNQDEFFFSRNKSVVTLCRYMLLGYVGKRKFNKEKLEVCYWYVMHGCCFGDKKKLEGHFQDGQHENFRESPL